MKAIILTDLGFGDAGKGSLTDTLVRRYNAGLVVRYNGGAQAAHTVQTATGYRHTFHQFGSGTLVPGTETFLSRHVLFNPLVLVSEQLALQEGGITDACRRLFVDARAMVTTPYHMIANRLREMARGVRRHGSCGLGIGETVAAHLACPEETISAGDLREERTLRTKLQAVRHRKQKEMDALCRKGALPAAHSAAVGLVHQLNSEQEFDDTLAVFRYISEQIHIVDETFLAERLSRPGFTIFEGAQGVLLDEDYGFHPHTTWSRTTPANADDLLTEASFTGTVTRLGLLRAYQTRHGAGPFPTESAALTRLLSDPNNPTNPWQGPFRVGWLDLPLTRYALRACNDNIDALAISCLDQLPETPKVATDYRLQDASYDLLPGPAGDLVHTEQQGRDLYGVTPLYENAPADADDYARWVAERLSLPLAVTSFGPDAGARRFSEAAAL